MDHIFVLSSIVQVYLFNPGRKVFDCFIDKKVFPTVNHDLLWRKLLSLCVSAKFIQVIKREVVQGDLLSPVFFILTIRDLASFLLRDGLRGISI